MAADYSKNEIERMQREAVRRVKEMQDKTRKSVDRQHGQDGRPENVSTGPTMPSFLRSSQHREERSAPQNPHMPHEDTERKKPQGKTKGFDLLSMINLKNFQMDSDRTIVLLLLTLLSGDETDELLLLALMYILL